MFKVMLIIVVITAGDDPNPVREYPMKDLNTCWASARAWVDQDPALYKGVGLVAECGKIPIEGQDVGTPG